MGTWFDRPDSDNENMVTVNRVHEMNSQKHRLRCDRRERTSNHRNGYEKLLNY